MSHSDSGLNFQLTLWWQQWWSDQRIRQRLFWSQPVQKPRAFRSALCHGDCPTNILIVGDAGSRPAVPVPRGRNWFYWWVVSTENKKHDLKVENYSLFGGLPKDLSPWHSLSDSSEQLLQRCSGRRPMHMIMVKVEYMQSSAYFTKGFLLIMRSWPASWEICMQVRKQQLELDMEQQTGSK